MSLSPPSASFRFFDSDNAGLNRIVDYQRRRVGNIWQAADITRTSVLRVLIQLECNRIDEEEDKEKEKMEKTMAEARRVLDQVDADVATRKMLDSVGSTVEETARQRKSRLQRARREKTRNGKAAQS